MKVPYRIAMPPSIFREATPDAAQLARVIASAGRPGLFSYFARRLVARHALREMKRIFMKLFRLLHHPRHYFKILLPFFRISANHNPVSRPREGRFAIVTSVGRGMRWT
jgi:hypothetical protein